jgi:hypothetical protein
MNMSVANDNQSTVIKFVQELLSKSKDTPITPLLISEKIDMVIKMCPEWEVNLNRKFVIDELIRRFSLWIGHDTTLRNEDGHINWLNSARKKDWKYWQRYRIMIERKLSLKVVDSLDESTDIVLGLLEDPEREGGWDRRGLVVGHVQSGKTGHYTGLICKAADAGYKIIIVLAGMHNNLRSQTQIRLDEGFLGYETSANSENLRPIGVGEIDTEQRIRPNFATNRSERGDFNTALSRNLGITPEEKPWLFVVKKNKTVLTKLLRWIKNHVANSHDQETGRKIVTNLQLLVIDDEADHASVDTGVIELNSDGNPDEEHQPTAINSLIRSILHSFTRAAYVGYTATPFANIYIHHRSATINEGPDLFPSAFIHNLAAPSNYIGPSQMFGTSSEEDSNRGLQLVRTIDDFEGSNGEMGWMPLKHKNGHIPLYRGENTIPPSLEDAIFSFLLACSVRQLRGQKNQHSSMLVHVTRFNSVQNIVCKQIEEFVRQLKQRLTRRIDYEGPLKKLKRLWEEDFVPATVKIRKDSPDTAIEIDIIWEAINEILPDVISDIQVRTINGTAKDALDYVEHEGTGLKVIAIGGDKLARGLTLEGLCVSYFLRASKMYDTLMQMGRWFGYRPGYQDVCRLFTTNELMEWFGHIADAAEELREEFDLMASSGGTPRDYGLKVASHSVMMITSRLKMREAKTLLLSFSGQLLETIALFRNSVTLEKNLDAAISLISTLNDPEINPVRNRNDKKQKWQGYLWEKVPASYILDFLNEYETHPEALKVDSRMIAEFIQSMMREGELTQWTVVLIGGGEGTSQKFTNSISVNMLERTKKDSSNSSKYSIGRLMSSRDESIDLDNVEWEAALKLTRSAWKGDPARSRKAQEEPDNPNGPAIRKIRGFGVEGVSCASKRGVLFLYALDPKKSSLDLSLDTPAVIAFGISFPASNSGQKVEYKANVVWWEQENGSAE